MRYKFRILGPATIVSNGEDAVLPPTKPSAILASLLVKTNAFVSLEYLKYTLWGESPPANADVTLPTYILRLRRLLRKHDPGSDPIETMSRGYRFAIPSDGDSLDLIVFQRLLEKGALHRASGDLESERAVLSRAEKLWRGPALSNIPSEALHREETPALNDSWFDVLERRFTIDLSMGRLEDIIPQIRRAITHRPERERYWEQMIEALYRTGRTSDALEEYRKVHDYLTTELGIEPRPSLQHLHLQVLRQAEVATEPRELVHGSLSTSANTMEATRVPQGLPASPDFLGKDDYVDTLVEQVTDSDAPAVIVSGPPGVGKTEAALQVARRCAGRFPGGVHFARFRNPDGSPRSSTRILGELLLRSGANSADPAPGSGSATDDQHESDLMALWRETVTGRPCLVILAGVANSAECARFLPGSAESRTIITSRNSLPQLIAFHGARHHPLFPLGRAHSIRLLNLIIGPAAEAASPEDLARIADVCSGLPGALRLAGAKFVASPHLTLTQFSDLLEVSPLDQLSIAEESGTSLREQLVQCYTQVSPQARSLFLEIATAAPREDATQRLFDRFEGTPQELDLALSELYSASLIHHCGTGSIGVFRLLQKFAVETADTARPLDHPITNTPPNGVG
ncbi:AfsR/SARP family transcriptional regulator [Nocardiopsis oceani]